MATGTRPSDEHYWRQPWSSMLFAGDLFEAIPFGTQPTVAVEADDEDGAHKHYRNWRKRHFQPAAEAAGLTGARPYDLRHSFASLMLHEGLIGVVDLASQLGHSHTMTLNTYGHVIAELREAPRTSATESIESARRPQNDPTRNGPEPGESKTALARPSRRADSNR